MAGLLCREDMDEVRGRLTRWIHSGRLGRPVMLLTCPRAEPVEHVPPVPAPDTHCPRYTIKSLEFRANRGARICAATHYLGEATPIVNLSNAAGDLALYLGCNGVETEGTVWHEPCIREPEEARFAYDPDNVYWDFTLRLARELKRIGEGRFLLEYPDLIEGLDVLASMRGTEPLLVDLVERSDWVQRCMRRITDLYFRYYDVLYDRVRDEVGGSHFWVWAPGRMVKLQCDFSAMISPAMFADFMVPVLTEMTERISYSMYHWDGPGAIQHHDHLLGLERLDIIQWVPGDGVEPPADRRWWPLYHKTVEAGKKLFTYLRGLDDLLTLKAEFGPKLQDFMFTVRARTPAEAEEMLLAVEV
jgi:5-methyltetrahydrofolate--homocysteine methyltransferase